MYFQLFLVLVLSAWLAAELHLQTTRLTSQQMLQPQLQLLRSLRQPLLQRTLRLLTHQLLTLPTSLLTLLLLTPSSLLLTHRLLLTSQQTNSLTQDELGKHLAFWGKVFFFYRGHLCLRFVNKNPIFCILGVDLRAKHYYIVECS